MSKFHFRRFFTLLLALVMALSVSAVPAFAEEYEYYWVTRQEALEILGTEYTGAPYFLFESNMDTYNKAKELSEEIVGDETDPYRKAKLIFQWMAKNCEYDHDRILEVKNRGIPYYEKGYIYESGYTGICADFAKLFQELCWTQNIPCELVSGRLISNGMHLLHAWNAFYANGEWHWVDATSSSMKAFDISDSLYDSTHRAASFDGGTLQSEWAQPWVLRAMQTGLLDIGFIDGLCDKYGVTTWNRTPGFNLLEDCSRLQFAQLAVNLLEVYFDKSIDDILADKGVAINEGVFTDTADKDVLAANALGIVGGYGNGIYNPDGELKRQEAAAILYRTAKVMGLETEGADLAVFTDLDSISTWAHESVAFCKATGVMSGTSETTFDAQSNYTREQCVVTIVRLFEAAD